MAQTEAIFAKDSNNVKFVQIDDNATDEWSTIINYADDACKNGCVIIIENAIKDEDKKKVDAKINKEKLHIKEVGMIDIKSLSGSSGLSKYTYEVWECKKKDGKKKIPQQSISEIKEEFETVWNEIPTDIKEQITKLRDINIEETNAMDYLQSVQITINALYNQWCLNNKIHFTATNTNRNIHPKWSRSPPDNYVLGKLNRIVNCQGIFTWMLIAGCVLYPARPHIENVNSGSLNLLTSDKKLWMVYDAIHKQRIENEVFPCIWNEVC